MAEHCEGISKSSIKTHEGNKKAMSYIRLLLQETKRVSQSVNNTWGGTSTDKDKQTISGNVSVHMFL